MFFSLPTIKGGMEMYDGNNFHIGLINSGFGIEVAGVKICFDEGELIYILAEVYDEDSDCILWFAVMKSVSKDVIRLNSEFVNIISRGKPLRISHFLG